MFNGYIIVLVGGTTTTIEKNRRGQCVFVCVREYERERERDRHQNPQETMLKAYHFVIDETRRRR